jgi:putative nucleotidyltransferase with HDIG domain
MDKREFRKAVYAKVDQLPTLPVVLPKLLGLIESDRARGEDIVQTIASDPSLTSKILQVANSAYYGFSKTISNLDRAVPLLGLNMVKSLALTMSVLRSLPKTADSKHFSQQGLWMHSLAVATAIHELGKRLRLETEYLFTLGLLHDVGKIVLFHFFNDLYTEVLRLAHEGGKKELQLAEREVVGLDHGEAGLILLTRWKFPAVISGPIGVHHQDEIPPKVDEVDVALLRTADALALSSGVGDSGAPAPPSIPQHFMEILRMKDGDMAEMREFMSEKNEDIAALYAAMG